MRQERTVQASIFDLFAGHEIGCELKTMSQWLDQHGELLDQVTQDLRRHGVKPDLNTACKNMLLSQHVRRAPARVTTTFWG